MCVCFSVPAYLPSLKMNETQVAKQELQVSKSLKISPFVRMLILLHSGKLETNSRFLETRIEVVNTLKGFQPILR